MAKGQPAALVTGASSGIGETFARTLSRMGYVLILVARRKERLERLAAELGNSQPLAADLTDDRDLLKVESIIAAESGLEFLVNNAGFGIPGRFHETDPEEQDRMHRLHILAIERLTHAALKGMVERQKGNIINVSSIAGFFTTPHNVTYSATKAWINRFTEGLYLELRSIQSPVRVQALCPGFTYSEFHDVIGMDRDSIPKYLWMSSEDVVKESLKGLERNKLLVIPGWRYRLVSGLLACFPRPLKHFIALRYGNAQLKNPR